MEIDLSNKETRKQLAIIARCGIKEYCKASSTSCPEGCHFGEPLVGLTKDTPCKLLDFATKKNRNQHNNLNQYADQNIRTIDEFAVEVTEDFENQRKNIALIKKL